MYGELETRVRRLERENRRLKVGTLLVLLVCGGVLVMGQSVIPNVKNEIVTRKLLLVDDSGNTRAILEVVPGEGPGLTFLKSDGTNSLVLAAAASGPTLVLNHDNGVSCLSLRVTKDGPTQFLYHPTSKAAVGIAAIRQTIGLVCMDNAGRVVWQAPE